MSLVEYSSSEEESEDSLVTKLELPTFLTTLTGDPLRFDTHKDDPECHQHRQRSFPHEVGNWSTSVFIPCKFLNRVNRALAQIQVQTHDLTSCSESFVSTPLFF